MYASVADVRAAGAAAALTDPQITAALGAAKERIDRYCGDTFESTGAITVRALLAGGLAPLPMRVQTVTAVRYADVAGGGSTLPATSYAVRSSATYGDIDAIQLLGYGVLSAALLDVTYEPVRSNVGATDERAVLVDGTFGWTTTPDAVHDAAVQLALADLPGGGTNGTVNAEGDADLGVPPTVPSVRRVNSTTGSEWADALLKPYRRETLRIS